MENLIALFFPCHKKFIPGHRTLASGWAQLPKKRRAFHRTNVLQLRSHIPSAPYSFWLAMNVKAASTARSLL
jgi:hypothetical protein